MASEETDRIDGMLHAVLEDLDEIREGVLTERQARLYFAVERYLYPENEIFLPENLAATEREYLKRVGEGGDDGPQPERLQRREPGNGFAG
jgi:hypothetical protein